MSSPAVSSGIGADPALGKCAPPAHGRVADLQIWLNSRSSRRKLVQDQLGVGGGQTWLAGEYIAAQVFSRDAAAIKNVGPGLEGAAMVPDGLPRRLAVHDHR